MSVTTNTERRIAFLFPGQGGFDGAALQAAHSRHPEVRQVFDQIDRVTHDLFDRRLSQILLDEHPKSIAELLADDPWVSQLAIYGSGLAAHEILLAEGVTPTVLVGHSLGEITALVAAGAFTVTDGARVVVRRVQVIEQLGPIDGQMVALGADAEQVARLIALLADPMVAIATINHDKETVVSGPSAVIEQAAAIARAMSVSAVQLDAAFPFHSPMLAAAVEPFAASIRALDQHQMNRAVFSPVLRRYYEPADTLAELISSHFVEPVHFAETLRELHKGGYECFVEAGGMGTLTKLVGKVIVDPRVRALPTLVIHHSELAMTDSLREIRADGTLSKRAGVGNGAGLASEIAPTVPSKLFDAFWREHGDAVVQDVTERVTRWAAYSEAAAHSVRDDAAAGEPSNPEPGTTQPEPAFDRDELFAAVSADYAEALEYPTDVFEKGVLLEAELGIDSVKQIELLTRVSTKYGVPPREDAIRLPDFDTMDKVVDYLHALMPSHEVTGMAATS